MSFACLFFFSIFNPPKNEPKTIEKRPSKSFFESWYFDSFFSVRHVFGIDFLVLRFLKTQKLKLKIFPNKNANFKNKQIQKCNIAE